MKGKLLALSIAAAFSLSPITASAITPEQQQLITDGITVGVQLPVDELIEQLVQLYPGFAEEIITSVMGARPGFADAIAVKARKMGFSNELITTAAISAGIDPANIALPTAAGASEASRGTSPETDAQKPMIPATRTSNTGNSNNQRSNTPSVLAPSIPEPVSKS